MEEISNKALELAAKVASSAVSKASDRLAEFLMGKKAAYDFTKDSIINNPKLDDHEKSVALYNIRPLIKEWENQYQIADIAKKIAQPETDFSYQSKVDEEFLSRYMESAKYVSNSELQEIWGKILAKEFELPNSTPKTIIRILSEISTQAAEDFGKLCSFSVDFYAKDPQGKINSTKNHIIMVKDNWKIYSFYNNQGLTPDRLEFLEEIGLIRFNDVGGISSLSGNYKDDEFFLSYGTEQIPLQKFIFHVGNIQLTKSGEYLRTILENREFNSEYFEIIKEYYLSPQAYEGIHI